MAINTEGFKTIKLPPAYPPGSDYIDLGHWQDNSLAKASRKRALHQGYIVAYEQNFGVGGTKHVELLDVGGSFAADDLGLVDAPYWSEPLNVLKPDDLHPLRGGAAPNARTKGGYHQKRRGVQAEVNGGKQ